MYTQQTTSTPPITPTGCCPPFDPATWDGREVHWHDKPFLKEHVRSLFHVPLNMGRRVTHAMAQIEAAGARAEHPLMLSDEISAWGSDLYIDVTRPVPGAEMAALEGTFMTRVYDGPFRDAPVWADEMQRHVKAKGRTMDKLYFAYTTCPKCAKAYGHNYVVLFAKLADAPA